MITSSLKGKWEKKKQTYAGSVFSPLKLAKINVLVVSFRKTLLLLGGLLLSFTALPGVAQSPDSLRKSPADSVTLARPDSSEKRSSPKQSAAASAATTPGAVAPDTVRFQLRPNQVAIAQYKDDNNYIKIVYGQPLTKGRVVFGNLEKWGQLWRTGANEATEITFIRDVKLDGKVLRAGTYALFTIPNPDKWTIILNSELGQWGIFTYKPEKDVMRFDVPARKNDQLYEALTFKFNETNTGVDLDLMWDTVKVTIPISFSRL